MAPSKLPIISLFSGAGGLDYGLEAAGFDTRVAVEFDDDAVATLRRNRAWPVLHRDIHQIPSDELLRVAGLKEGDAALVVGGPPCQPFSKSGYWARGDARRLDDPRASTLEAYLRVIRDAKPRAFLFENVRGIKYSKKDEGFRLLERTIESINRSTGTRYRLHDAVLNSADYGVPQERERLFIVAQRDGAPFEFPVRTHAEPFGDDGQFDLPGSGHEPLLPMTAWDAIGDLEEDDDPSLQMGGKWARLLPTIPEGQNYLFHTDRGGGLPLFGWRRRYWSFLLKLAKDRPSWTITAQPGSAIGPFHWRNRRLSMRELCRLQTFPDDIIIQGSRLAVQKQAGNAVPSALAEILGLAIRAQLLGGRRRVPGLSPTLLPRRREPVPPPEAVARVPRIYLSLTGDHSPHPGTGKGFGALARDRGSVPAAVGG